MSAKSLGKKAAYTFGLTLWIVFSLVVGQALASIIVINQPFALNSSVSTTILAALGYVFALALALGVPALMTKKIVPKKTLGLHRLPSWSDIGIGILAVLPYYLLAGIAIWLGMEVFKVVDPNVGQQIPFQDLTLRIEFMVAFLTLVIMAPIAEEILFRGYFLGRLSDRTGKWLAVGISSLVFGLMHLVGAGDSGIVLQWAAAADTFAMGLVAGTLRVISGSIWAGVLLHAIKNGIAFYFLFINPSTGV